MMFTSSAQGSTPGVPGAHTASLAPEQADSISEIFADGLGNGYEPQAGEGPEGSTRSLSPDRPPPRLSPRSPTRPYLEDRPVVETSELVVRRSIGLSRPARSGLS
jgi:hypothetical protein